MAHAARTLEQCPALRAAFRRFHATAWPDFLQDEELSALFPLIYEKFPAFQFGLLDARGRVLAVGNTVPFVWDGARETLPDRMVDVVAAAIRAQERGRPPTTLSALAAIVAPPFRSRRLSRRVLLVMRSIARTHGLTTLVAPVRPTLKGLYPLASMAAYAAWQRSDGAPFDPWLRVHWRLGARVLRVARRAMSVTATVVQWEAWTGLRFPVSGRYVVPGGFNPVTIDRRRNVGRYVEPNVWMRHPVRPTAPSARR